MYHLLVLKVTCGAICNLFSQEANKLLFSLLALLGALHEHGSQGKLTEQHEISNTSLQFHAQIMTSCSGTRGAKPHAS